MVTLTEIIEILEAETPANPLAPKNQKLRGELERKLAKYFISLEQAFPYSAIDKLYNKYAESASSDAEKVISNLLSTFDDQLLETLDGELHTIYTSGTAEMTTWGKTKGGIPISYEGPPVQGAIDFARDRGAALVTQMDDESKRRLSKVISDGIANKRGIPGIQRDLRTTFTDMSKFRSTMIARTETADALSQASLASMEDMGIEGKEWVVNQPCDICLANEADGVIPVNQSFSSGDQAPPAHPNCECALAPALLKK